MANSRYHYYVHSCIISHTAAPNPAIKASAMRSAAFSAPNIYIRRSPGVNSLSYPQDRSSMVCSSAPRPAEEDFFSFIRGTKNLGCSMPLISATVRPSSSSHSLRDAITYHTGGKPHSAPVPPHAVSALLPYTAACSSHNAYGTCSRKADLRGMESYLPTQYDSSSP